MIYTDVAIIGGGPAGLCAAYTAAKAGAEVILIERDAHLGGQLVKQTHKFFGSEKQYASVRGIDICSLLVDQATKEAGGRVTLMTSTTVLGLYEDGVLTIETNGLYQKIHPKKIILATGAAEKFLGFPNNDLPGVYGAGAVQTLMNVYGVKPGHRVLIVGSGNIALIVAYQMLQAGIEVAAVMNTSGKIGGYLVHASKIRRAGVPILAGYTIKRVDGTDCVESATVVGLDEKRQPIPGSEQVFAVDTVCIAVGLSPLTELLGQAGCKMRYVPQLGGHVPVRDANQMSSVEGIYIAGDVAGIEEASSAMVEGYLAGLCAAHSLGYALPDYAEQRADLLAQLRELRSGPVGDKIRTGLDLALAYV